MGLRHPGEVVLAEMLGPGRAFVTRGMLTGIKRRVECLLQAEEFAAKAVDDFRRRAESAASGNRISSKSSSRHLTVVGTERPDRRSYLTAGKECRQGTQYLGPTHHRL